MNTDERKNRIAELAKEMGYITAELQRLNAEQLVEESPFQVGDIIEWDYRKKGVRRGRVVKLMRRGGQPMAVAVITCKDGCCDEGVEVKIDPYQNPRVVEAKQ